jgi:outer membrane protein assembly factor BamB
MITRSLLLATLFAALTLPARADDWPRFRGPNGSGLSADTIPAKWEKSNFKWTLDLPGVGHSSPSIIGDHLFITCAAKDASERMLLCVNAPTGDILWKKTFPNSAFKQHGDNSYAAATPAADAEQVYVAWVAPESYVLAAFDHSGKEIWKADLGPYKSQHMNSSSPILFEDMVIMANDQDGPSFVIAFDRKTGNVRWKTPRHTKVAASATPCIYQPAGQSPQLILSSTAEGVTAYNPRTGGLLWQVGDVFKHRVVASPTICGDLIIANCGEGPNGKMLVAIHPPTAKDAKPTLAWSLVPNTPYVPTPVARGNHLFIWTDTGTVTCVDGKTGNEIWQERLGNGFYTSPVCAGDKLFGITKKGEVIVLSAADKPGILARNSLNEMVHSTPAIAGGRMFIHTYGKLICIGQ